MFISNSFNSHVKHSVIFEKFPGSVFTESFFFIFFVFSDCHPPQITAFALRNKRKARETYTTLGHNLMTNGKTSFAVEKRGEAVKETCRYTGPSVTHRTGSKKSTLKLPRVDSLSMCV